MPTNLHWHTPEYVPRPDDAAGPSTLTANKRDTLQKLQSSHIAATTALVFDIAELVLEREQMAEAAAQAAHHTGVKPAQQGEAQHGKE